MTEVLARRLACLVHDVGKLRARSERGEHPDRDHRRWSGEFVRRHVGDEDTLRLVETHHEDQDDLPDRLRRAGHVLRAANRLAGGRTETGGSQSVRLRSVFDVLRTEGDGDRRASSRTYPLRPLSLDRETLFPQTDHSTDDADGYERLWSELMAAVPADPAYETLVDLLEKYTWCVPATPATDDLPLFDHLRTTAAVGDALAGSDLSEDDLAAIASGERPDEDRPLYTLVKGDLSGIQRFIRRLRNPDDAQDRIAKRTRGRSIQLWLLNEGIARAFLCRLDLPVTSLVWRGGGQFYALVPPTKQDAIADFETEVNRWLLDRFDADIFFVQGTATATDPRTDFSTLFARAAGNTDENKLRKGSAVLSDLDSPVLGDPREPCNACGGEMDPGPGVERCTNCRIQEAIGQRLPRGEYVQLGASDRADADFTIDLPDGGLSWTLSERPDAPGVERAFRLNGTDLPGPDTDVPVGFAFTGAAVPFGGGVDRVWSFTELQHLGRGTGERVHVTKMDIDGLGAALSSGMAGGPARLAALSRALELFFSGYVNRIALKRAFVYPSPTGTCDRCESLLEDAPSREVEHGRGATPVETATYYRPEGEKASGLHDECVERVSPIYVGFSGGDDALFVGPWDEAVAFGRDLRSAFEEFCGGTLTVSAGFTLVRPTYPVGRAVEDAEQQLERAKDFTYEGRRKDAATLFGETLGWELPDHPGMIELLDFAARLEALVTGGELSRSTLQALLDTHSDTYPRGVHPGSVPTGKEKEWKIKYLLARKFEGEQMIEIEDDVSAAMPWMSVPVSWAALATR